jgi:hypothetical protein
MCRNNKPAIAYSSAVLLAIFGYGNADDGHEVGI